MKRRLLPGSRNILKSSAVSYCHKTGALQTMLKLKSRQQQDLLSCSCLGESAGIQLSWARLREAWLQSMGWIQVFFQVSFILLDKRLHKACSSLGKHKERKRANPTHSSTCQAFVHVTSTNIPIDQSKTQKSNPKLYPLALWPSQGLKNGVSTIQSTWSFERNTPKFSLQTSSVRDGLAC